MNALPSLRIVVCDESDVIRAQIKIIARTRKIDVVEAETGHQAFAALMVSDAQCAFLHVHLPDISGFEIARRVTAAKLPARPTLVALAGWLSREEAALVDTVGFDRWISRPLDPAHIEAVLAELQERVST